MDDDNIKTKERWQQLAGVKVLKEGAGPWDFGGDEERDRWAAIHYDLYKDVHGIRPRGTNYAAMTAEQIKAEIAQLDSQLESVPVEDEKHFVDPLPSSDEIDDMASFYHADSPYDTDLDDLPKFGSNKKLKEAPSEETDEFKKLQDDAMTKASQLVKAMAALDSPLGSMDHVKLLGIIMDVAKDAHDMGFDQGYDEGDRDVRQGHEEEDRLDYERQHSPERLGEEGSPSQVRPTLGPFAEGTTPDQPASNTTKTVP